MIAGCGGEQGLTCYDSSQSSCLVLILFIFLPFIGNCKIQGDTRDALDRSVQFISVDGMVTLSFRSESPLQCDVLVGDTAQACSKPEGSEMTWQARLGALDPEQAHKVELHIRPEGGDKSSQRTYTWRAGKQAQRDYRLKLNIPLLTAEAVRVEGMSMPDPTTDKFGCSIESSEGKVLKNIEAPFIIADLTTRGFGETSAERHARNSGYVRLNYEKFAREQEWNFRYVVEEGETLFTLKPPALLRGVTANSDHNVSLVDTLTGRQGAGKVSNRTPVEVTWQIDNPTTEMHLSIFVTSDDKDTQGKCFADPKDERMELDKEFLQQLPAGRYTMLVQLQSTQKVGIFGSTSTSWLVDTYDWRQGAFEKL